MVVQNKKIQGKVKSVVAGIKNHINDYQLQFSVPLSALKEVVSDVETNPYWKVDGETAIYQARDVFGMNVYAFITHHAVVELEISRGGDVYSATRRTISLRDQKGVNFKMPENPIEQTAMTAELPVKALNKASAA